MMLRSCFCAPREKVVIRVLEFQHANLEHVPPEIFEYTKSLEELYLDSNQIRDLPRPLFMCHGLQKLGLSDNELLMLPPAVASLVSLTELDISKNGIRDLPESIKACKNLTYVEASVNPLGKLPDGFTQLLNLTELYLNDTFMDYLPGNFGRLTRLKVLEVRENHMKTLPKSISRLILLERLDMGNNDFSELPEVVCHMSSLQELWVDSNAIHTFPQAIRYLQRLSFLDASKNQLEDLPEEVEHLTKMTDLHLSTNLLQDLPAGIGALTQLVVLKVDDNQLLSLPHSIGGLASLQELDVSYNDLEHLPPTIGLLRRLRTLIADENCLMELPAELGSCSSMTVLSVRSNQLERLPDEIGRIPNLKVINVSDNRLEFLPFNFTKLKKLWALWLAENQSKPLIPLQSEYNASVQGRVLTCYLLPQQQGQEDDLYMSDKDSFHPSLWEEERQLRQTIQFDVVESPDREPVESQLRRCPTPHSRELRSMKCKLLVEDSGVETPPSEVVSTSSTSQVQPDVRRPSEVRVKEAKLSKPRSPQTSPLLRERHLLFKADKEKQQRDKARMRRRSGSSSMGSEDEVSPLGKRTVSDAAFLPQNLNGPLQCKEKHAETAPVRYQERAVDVPDHVLRTQQVISAAPPSSDFPPSDYSQLAGRMYAVQRGERVKENRKSAPVEQLLEDSTAPGSLEDGKIFSSTPDLYRHSPPSQPSAAADQHVTQPSQPPTGQQEQFPTTTTTTMSRGDRTMPRSISQGIQTQQYGTLPAMSKSESTKDFSSHEFVSSTPPSQQLLVTTAPSVLSQRSPVPKIRPQPPPRSILLSTEQVSKLPNSQSKSEELSKSVVGDSNKNTPPPDVILSDSTVTRNGKAGTNAVGKNTNVSRPLEETHPTPLSQGQPGVSTAAHSHTLERLSQPVSMSDTPIIPGNFQSMTLQRPRPSVPPSYQQSLRYSQLAKLGFQPGKSAFRLQHSKLQDDTNIPPSAKDPAVSNYSQQPPPPTSPPSSPNRTMAGVQHDAMADKTSTTTPTTTTTGGHRVVVNLELTPDGRGTSQIPPEETQHQKNAAEPPAKEPEESDDWRHTLLKQIEDSIMQAREAGYPANSSDGESDIEKQGSGKRPPTPPTRVSSVLTSSVQSLPVSTTSTIQKSSSSQPRPKSTSNNYLTVTIEKKPGLGFSIAGGIGSCGNPFNPEDTGIFVTKILPGGPADGKLSPGDKILQVEQYDFTQVEHDQAVMLLRAMPRSVTLVIERR
ncbi:leucine-rich repeat-containing protein 7-like isoform X2 [Branchiostoma floridae]|uniref:Leucine-rich repeat-containing protein 7-like isoform X2 n=1 Tax=Branchiostoma floridae TaxID=7739 RepID=A0A9J7MDC4_BRAFL|nr:leucine-rich repeat-containing protein 7-like isoform X2 [Branchiostoma floridae]